ncbi:hypothetical protein L7F22_017967 [Adiantum nelumboides]|nr:hypothetical protein [Adiantum nelumboides]
MKKDTLHYIQRCLICQKTKAERVKIPEKLQPLDIPQMKWECICMDFVTGLPKTTGNYDSIFVIVDKLTKVAHLIPVKQTATAAGIAQVFVKELVRLHGIPAKIISDQDANFTSKFWQAMFQSLGTQLNLSTAYHPETDGQTERVNQVIEDMLRAYCNQQPQKWIKFLHLVELAYNSSHHRSLGMSPFKALYGQECLVPLQFADPTLYVPATKSTLETMDQQLLIIRMPRQKTARQWDKAPYEVDELLTNEKSHIPDEVLAQIPAHIFIAKFRDEEGDNIKTTIMPREIWTLRRRPQVASAVRAIHLEQFFRLPPWGTDYMRAHELMSSIQYDGKAMLTDSDGAS